MENNIVIGQDFINIIKNLTKEERNLLLKLSNNVIDKAKKRGFPTYVNVNNYKWGNIIELVIKHNHQNIESGGGKPEYHFMNDFKYKEERGVKINDKLEFDVTTGQYNGDWDESTISFTKYLSLFEEKFKDGGAIKSKGTFNPIGSAKELGITPKIEGHDMIAKCDCGEKFSYQNSKKNIIWECPECNGMKRIVENKMADGGEVGKYSNMYFGKGYELDAITELKKALPNYIVKSISKHSIGIFIKTSPYIDNYSGEEKTERVKAIIDTDSKSTKYGRMTIFKTIGNIDYNSAEGEMIGAVNVEKLDQAIREISIQ
jgi:hypothetical protein